MKTQMATFRKRLQPADISEAAMSIIADAVSLESALPMAGVTRGNGMDVTMALYSIQRQARELLNPLVERDEPLAGLVEFIERLERGEHVPLKEVTILLAGLQVASAKIRKYMAESACVPFVAGNTGEA